MCFTRARRQLVISWSERLDTPPSRADDDGGRREQQLKRSRFVKNLPTEIVHRVDDAPAGPTPTPASSASVPTPPTAGFVSATAYSAMRAPHPHQAATPRGPPSHQAPHAARLAAA